jgi:pyruvate, water dikinase
VTVRIRPLGDVTDPSVFGGKAVQLGAAIRAGLPVPHGVALSWDTVDAVADGDTAAIDTMRVACAGGGPWAVRSSAVGEDSGAASFAGTHDTVLGVAGVHAIADAVRRVRKSAHEAAARGYRARLGIAGTPRMGVVVQVLVDAEVAGVLFTRNPVTGVAERVIEASWGLGEAVVAGLVTPDRYRLDAAGRVRERRRGDKDVAVRRHGPGTAEVPVPAALVHALCLGDRELAALHGLAAACDAVFGPTGHDVEFAFAGGTLFLLQRRPITGG